VAEDLRDVVFYTPSAGPLLAVDPRSPAGGAENQVLMLARELARRGYAVAIIAFGDPGSLSEQIGGVSVIEHPLPSTRLPLVRTLAHYRDAFATLRKNRARALIQRAAGIHTALVALTARSLGCRFVYATAGVHEFDLRSWEPKRWIGWAFRLGIRLADVIVVQSEEQAHLCRERFGREPLLIKSIAEPAPLRRRRGEAFLWIGSLIDYKQPFAFVELARAVPEARFWMIGTEPGTPEGRELEGAIARAAATIPNLELLPPRPRSELGQLIARAAAIVSTSRTEGMPNVFLEGWSRGVPSLALAHDPDGVLERERLGEFAHGSSAEMAELARSVWRARDDQREQASRCRAYVEREHSPALVADRWVAAVGL
jgi:glycosyltransferase involved in cell wall biosynthesis